MDRFRPVVLIPAYREADSIGTIVKAVSAYAPVIVADDCSSDGTAEAAETAGAYVIRNSVNLGYVDTLNALFETATKHDFTHAVTMDADGEHDPSCLPIFLHLLGSVPLVIGTRLRTQRLAEAITSLYVCRYHGVRDIFCGMKGYDLDLIKGGRRFDNSGSVGTETALRAIRSGLPFAQAPVNGVKRRDAPRFGGRWRANLQLLSVLLRIVRDDCDNRSTK